MRLIAAILVALSSVALAPDAPVSTHDPVFCVKPSLLGFRVKTSEHYCEHSAYELYDSSSSESSSELHICDASCHRRYNGVVNINMGGSTVKTECSYSFDSKLPTSMSGANLVDQDISPGEDKHYICSTDRTGILICRYGFCSTDRYCRRDEECSGDSASCESLHSIDQ